ncbi:hypothetical protein Tco_0930604, partial [Tanacetum coccineum]
VPLSDTWRRLSNDSLPRGSTRLQRWQVRGCRGGRYEVAGCQAVGQSEVDTCTRDPKMTDVIHVIRTFWKEFIANNWEYFID